MESENLDICLPPFAEWATGLDLNTDHRKAVAARIGPGAYQSMRQDVLDAARAFTKELALVADRVGVKAPTADLELFENGSTAETPIVATGHQPVVFHPGILTKNLRMESLAREQNAIGLMVLIDTDEGDAMQFRYPRREGVGLSQTSHSIGVGSGIYRGQRVADSTTVTLVKNHMVDALSDLGFTEAAMRTKMVMDQYSQLSGVPATIANSIIRRGWEHQPQYLELPLSKLVALPSIRSFLQSLIENGQALHETYNAVLAQYRRDHRIRNQANPFPSLLANEQSFELPFWILNESDGSRTPMMVRRSDNGSIDLGEHLVVPRGMLITTLLRLVVSDLFIHGTGGAKYDRCTDQFIQQWFDVAAPSYVQATSTRQLFSTELDRAAESKAHRDKIKDVETKFEKHTNSGTFEGLEHKRAVELLERRAMAISQLRQAKSEGRSASHINTELKSIKSDIDAFVREIIGRDFEAYEPSVDEMKVYSNREFPYFFFDQPESALKSTVQVAM